MNTTENIVEHASTGFCIPEPMARRIDELSRGLSAECKYRRLAKTADIDEINAKERFDVSYINTDDIDRDHEVVLPSGCDMTDWNKVVTPFHKYDVLPVGKSLWVRSKMKGQRQGLIAKTYYHRKPEDWGDGTPWLPSAILHLMQSEFPTCTGKSIGFLPVEIREATAQEKSQRPELKGIPIIAKWKMLEYSVVSVPANQAAEMETVSKALKSGAITQDIAEMIGLKDMGGAECSMPPCPNCKTNEDVQMLRSEKDTGGAGDAGSGDADGDNDAGDIVPGQYKCMKCMKEFHHPGSAAADKAIEAARQKKLRIERIIADSSSDAFITLESHKATLRHDAERQAKEYLKSYLAAMMGKV
jgi:hypothetical protein